MYVCNISPLVLGTGELMGAKLNFRETKKELDRRIEERRVELNDAQSHATDFFRGQLVALVELKYSIQGGEQSPEENR